MCPFSHSRPFVGAVTWKSRDAKGHGGVGETAWEYAQPCAARGRRETKRRTKRGEKGRREEENMCEKAIGRKSGKREGLKPTRSAKARDTQDDDGTNKTRQLPRVGAGTPTLGPGRRWWLISGVVKGRKCNLFVLTQAAMNSTQSSDEDNALATPLRANSTKRRRVQNQRACDRCRQKKSPLLSPFISPNY